jgi:hypothetical protein
MSKMPSARNRKNEADADGLEAETRKLAGESYVFSVANVSGGNGMGRKKSGMLRCKKEK